MGDQPDRIMEVTGDNDYRHFKDEGYIKLWRSMQHSSLWSMPLIDFKLFIYMVQEANWAPKKEWDGEVQADVMIPRGSFTTTLKKLADGIDSNKEGVRQATTRLVKARKITTESTHRKTLVTICNYEYYNGRDGKSHTVSTQQVHSKYTVSTQSESEGDQPKGLTEPQELKNTRIKEGSTTSMSVKQSDPRVEEVWNDYLATVAKHYSKNPRLTDATRKKILARLKTFNDFDFKVVHDNVVADPWEYRVNHCAPALIYRSDDMFQGWIDKDFSVKAKPGTPESLVVEPGKYDNVGETFSTDEEEE